jgi:hypothetical protein
VHPNQARDKRVHLNAGERVERRERLVQQQQLRLAGQRPCQRDTLGFTA